MQPSPSPVGSVQNPSQTPDSRTAERDRSQRTPAYPTHQHDRAGLLSPTTTKKVGVSIGTALSSASTSVTPPIIVNRPRSSRALLPLIYGTRIVLRLCTGKFVAVEEKERNVDADGRELQPASDSQQHQQQRQRWYVHGASAAACPFTLLNANRPNDRGEVRFQDSILLLSHAGTFLAAEVGESGAAADQMISCSRRDGSDARCRWSLLCGADDLLSIDPMTGIAPFTKARGEVKIFDRVILKSSTGTLLSVDEGDVRGALHHRDHTPRSRPTHGASGRTIATNATPVTQPCVLQLARASLPLVPDWQRWRGGAVTLQPPGSTSGKNSTSVSEADRPNDKSMAEFNALPGEVQEQLLLEDVLYALIGVQGKYIRMQQEDSEEEDAVTLTLDSRIKDTSLVSQVSRLLPCCSAYYGVQNYLHVHSRWEYGVVCHALSACIRSIIKEYLVVVAQLEFQFASRRLTLLRTFYYIQPSMHALTRLERVCRLLARQTGGSLLNVLHAELLSAGDDATQSLYTHLLTHASKPYYDMLRVWLTQGLIQDSYDEFHIKQRKDMRKENVRRDFNDTYWDERYTVKDDDVPAFMLSMSDKILTTGKYLNVIRECGRSIPPLPEPSQPLILQYSSDERACAESIDRCYSFASTLLHDLVIRENDLIGRLRSLKRYFLLSQGDFYSHLMDLTEDDLNKSIEQILPTKLKSLLELAIRTSGARSDPYHEDLSCYLQQYTLVQKLEAIHTTHQHTKKGARDESGHLIHPAVSLPLSLPRPALLKGHESLTLSYHVRWPLSLVLSKKALTKYQLLFRHLFSIKHAARCLHECWRHHQSVRELNLGRAYHHSFGLRQRMLHFFHNLAYYMMVEVLEPNWHRLEHHLSSVMTIDDVLRHHGSFLDDCLKQCLLTHQPILKTLHKLMLTSMFFAQHAQTSINTHATTDNEAELDSETEEAEAEARARRRRAMMNASAAAAAAAADGVPVDVMSGGAATLHQRASRIAFQTSVTLKSIQSADHLHMIDEFRQRFDSLLFDFLSHLRNKSHLHADQHFTNLYNRLDYNEWYTEFFKQRMEGKNRNV